MTITNNSVGRLFEVILLLQKKAKSKELLVGYVIADAFGIQREDTSKLIEIYLEILKITKKAEKEIEKLPDSSRDRHLRAIQNIERCFATNSLLHQWSYFQNFLDPATMTGLELTADALSHVVKSEVVGGEDVEKLQTEVNELLKLVLSTELDEELKIFLVERIEELQHAILYFRIKGSDGLREVLEKTIGAFAVYGKANKEKVNNMPQTIARQFALVVATLVKIVSFANDLKGLSGGDIPFLPGI